LFHQPSNREQVASLQVPGIQQAPVEIHGHGNPPGGNPGANLKSVPHRCNLREVASEWELTKETIHLPLGRLNGGEHLLPLMGWRFPTKEVPATPSSSASTPTPCPPSPAPPLPPPARAPAPSPPPELAPPWLFAAALAAESAAATCEKCEIWYQQRGGTMQIGGAKGGGGRGGKIFSRSVPRLGRVRIGVYGRSHKDSSRVLRGTWQL